MAKSKIKKGDIVKIIAGSHKGEQGPVTFISKNKSSVSVQGVEITKHVKPSQTEQEGGIKKIPAKVNISNVAIIDPKDKEATTRIGYEIVDGKKQRIAKKSNQAIK